MESEVKRQDIYDALKSAVVDALAYVRESTRQKKPISSYSDFPRLEYFDSGLPRVLKEPNDKAPLDYSTLFTRSFHSAMMGEPHPEEAPSWQHFFSLARDDVYLRKFLEPQEYLRKATSGMPGMEDFFDKFTIFGFIKEITNRYIHITKREDFDETLFRPLYIEWERATLLPRLPFDIVVPIIFLTFSFDELKLEDTLLIEKLDHDFQLARGSERWGARLVPEAIYNAATHALVLKGWSVENERRYARENTLSAIHAFSPTIPFIDRFFAALRAVTKVESGYSQIIIRPKDWADHWKAHLPTIYVAFDRAFPEKFEDYGWLKVPPCLDINTCQRIGELYRNLGDSKDNKLSLATQRLNSAFLRSNEEDSILDITIGLEALLVGDTKSEITYKLRMRLAALSKIEPHSQYTPIEISGLCDKVYAFRSAIIHGSPKRDKKRLISIKTDQTIPAVALGIDLLCFAISVLSRNPKYLNATLLDQYLLNNDANISDAREII